jgi:hypothetical protein
LDISRIFIVLFKAIKKVLHSHFSDLQTRLSSLQDPRKGIEYTIEELVMSAIVLFLLKCNSRNDFNAKCKDEHFRQNYHRMFRLFLPHMDAVTVTSLSPLMAPASIIGAINHRKIFKSTH